MIESGIIGHHADWVALHAPYIFPLWAKCILTFEYLHFTAVGLPKLAIVALYLRVFQWQGTMQRAAHAVVALLIATWLASVVTATLQCRPLEFWWDPTVPGGVCVDMQTFFRAMAVASPVLDIFVVALPVSTVWGLRIAARKKVELMFILTVGSL